MHKASCTHIRGSEVVWCNLVKAAKKGREILGLPSSTLPPRQPTPQLSLEHLDGHCLEPS